MYVYFPKTIIYSNYYRPLVYSVIIANDSGFLKANWNVIKVEFRLRSLQYTTVQYELDNENKFLDSFNELLLSSFLKFINSYSVQLEIHNRVN